MNSPQGENEISITNPVFQQIFLDIIAAYQWSSQKMKSALAPYDITYQQINVLRILKQQYPSNSTVSLIKDKIVDQMSDVSRIIDRLMIKGYVEKKVNHYDRRAAAIIITEKGLAILKKINREVNFASLFVQRLTTEEAAQLSFLLGKAKSALTFQDNDFRC